MVLEPGVSVLVAVTLVPRATTRSSAHSCFLRCRLCAAAGHKLLKEKSLYAEQSTLLM